MEYDRDEWGTLWSQITVFKWSMHEDFSLWKLRIKAALKGKELIQALSRDDGNNKISDKAFPIVIVSFGNNPLRTIQNCRTAMGTWRSLKQRYDRKTLMHKLGLLNNLLNTRYQNEEDIADHIAKIESQFAQLSPMGFAREKSIKVTLLSLSLNQRSPLEPMRVSVHNRHRLLQNGIMSLT